MSHRNEHPMIDALPLNCRESLLPELLNVLDKLEGVLEAAAAYNSARSDVLTVFEPRTQLELDEQELLPSSNLKPVPMTLIQQARAVWPYFTEYVSARIESARIESARMESAEMESAEMESAEMESAEIESAKIKSAKIDIIFSTSEDFRAWCVSSQSVGPEISVSPLVVQVFFSLVWYLTRHDQSLGLANDCYTELEQEREKLVNAYIDAKAANFGNPVKSHDDSQAVRLKKYAKAYFAKLNGIDSKLKRLSNIDFTSSWGGCICQACYEKNAIGGLISFLKDHFEIESRSRAFENVPIFLHIGTHADHDLELAINELQLCARHQDPSTPLLNHYNNAAMLSDEVRDYNAFRILEKLCVRLETTKSQIELYPDNTLVTFTNEGFPQPTQTPVYSSDCNEIKSKSQTRKSSKKGSSTTNITSKADHKDDRKMKPLIAVAIQLLLHHFNAEESKDFEVKLGPINRSKVSEVLQKVGVGCSKGNISKLLNSLVSGCADLKADSYKKISNNEEQLRQWKPYLEKVSGIDLSRMRGTSLVHDVEDYRLPDRDNN